MHKSILSGALLVIGALAGCASTVDDPRSKPPLVTLTSAKPVETVAACLAPVWSGQSYHWVSFDAVVQPRVGGGQLVKPIGGAEAADIVANGSGSKVMFFSRYNDAAEAWPSMRIEGIRQCL